MAKYRLKTHEVDAVQWFKVGDYPGIAAWKGLRKNELCGICDHHRGAHGKFRGPKYGYICPGDWIVKSAGVDGEKIMSDEEFGDTYELVTDG